MFFQNINKLKILVFSILSLLIFTALFSPFWPNGIFEPIATLSVLIYNFAAQPYDLQNQLAWAASFILVVFILALNLLARWLGRFASE